MVTVTPAALRAATLMVWADSPTFKACETDWQAGHFYKIRGTYQEHPTYGAQIDIENIRPVNDDDPGVGLGARIEKFNKPRLDLRRGPLAVK